MKFLKIICVFVGLLTCSASFAGNFPPEEREVWLGATEVLDQKTNEYFSAGEFDSLLPLLKMRYEIDPSSYDFVTDLGWILGSTDRPDEELAYYVRFRRENVGYANSALPEAQFYFLKKVYAKVPPLLEGSLTNESHPNNYRILANSYEKLGQFKDSKRVWEIYLAIAPSDGQAKANLKRVKQKLGERS